MPVGVRHDGRDSEGPSSNPFPGALSSFLISPIEEPYANLQAALARTLTRGIALYFSRPVRLFRPSKVSGWHSLRAHASKNGTSLTPQYMLGLLRTQGFVVIYKHFIPPMLVNAFLGTVLWTTYTETFTAIEPYCGSHPTISAGIAGAFAGGAQALLAAPAENVRIALEGGSGASSWSRAWKDVFRGTKTAFISKSDMEDIRQLRTWMKDIREMAGRGWNGWRWGLGKDMCGFTAFFSIFDITRRVASVTRSSTESYLVNKEYDDDGKRPSNHLPRIVHGMTLVTGGVIAGIAYEKMSLPWDVARRTIHLEKITSPPGERLPTTKLLLLKLRQDGLESFFEDHSQSKTSLHGTQRLSIRRHLYRALRTLGRVGPWGVGFLVWEASGYGQLMHVT